MSSTASLPRYLARRGLASSQIRSLTDHTQDMPSYERAAELIPWANTILILGGNITEQLARWRETGIDRLLIQAAKTDSAIFAGGSTGLMCWFRTAHTNTHRLAQPHPSHSSYRFEPALVVLPAIACAHYEMFHARTGQPRAASFRSMMARQPIGTVGIGVATHAALQITGDTVSFFGHDRYATIQRLERTNSEARIMTSTYKTDSPNQTFAEFFTASTR